MQVMASDADDPTYGSSARLVYSVLDGEHHFTVDPKTGEGRGRAKGAGPGGARGVGLGRGPHGVVCSPFQPQGAKGRMEDTEAFRPLQETQRTGKGQPDRKREGLRNKRMGRRAPARLAENKGRGRPLWAPERTWEV